MNVTEMLTGTGLARPFIAFFRRCFETVEEVMTDFWISLPMVIQASTELLKDFSPFFLMQRVKSFC